MVQQARGDRQRDQPKTYFYFSKKTIIETREGPGLYTRQALPPSDERILQRPVHVKTSSRIMDPESLES